MAPRRDSRVPRSPSPRRGVCRPIGAACVAVAAALAIVGCGGGPSHPWRAPAEPLVWPLPPAPPRIRHEGVIASGEIAHFHKSAFSVLDVLLGRPRIELGTPHGVCGDAATLAIADSGRGVVHLLNRERRRYRAIHAAGKRPLQCPIGVAADGEGGLFVSDAVLARVFRFTMDGALTGEVEAKLVRPAGLAYDAARRRLHVVDTGAHAVLTFETVGDALRLLRTIGRRGTVAGDFNFPTHATVDREGRLYVVDSMNHRVQIFGPEGKPLGGFGRAGDGTGDFSKAKAVALDARGHVYVTDSLCDVVQIFGRDGRFLLVFGGSGHGDGLLWLPTGIYIDGEDRIYVADSGNARVQVYRYVHPPTP